MSAGCIALAYFNQRQYGFACWVALALSTAMLAAWDAEYAPYAWTLIGFAALLGVSGYALAARTDTPVMWPALAGVSSLLYYLTGYYKLYPWTVALMPSMPLWGMIAVALAAPPLLIAARLLAQPHSVETKQRCLSVLAVASTAFVSLALTVELPREFLSVAFALEVMLVAWINTRIPIQALRHLAFALALAFAFLLLPQLLLLVKLTVYSLVEAQLWSGQRVPLVDWPVFQLGLPAAMLAYASLLLRKEKDDALVRGFEAAAIALFGMMGYYLMRHAFHIGENVLFTKPKFIERGFVTNAIFLYGLACLWLGGRYARSAVFTGGMVLCGAALFRIFYFDLLLRNPLWTHESVGRFPLVNALWLPFGLPVAWTLMARRALIQNGKPKLAEWLQPVALLLGFALLSLLIRQLYHGEFLDTGETRNAEIYTYSVAWLLLGAGLLFQGTLKDRQKLRVAGIGIMFLTVGKVFLYDASELTGLFRVFSFLGLGISLIGLSWFTTRFVFAKKE